MMVDFYESFGNNSDEDNDIPKEVLEELNKELPKNLIYFQNPKGRYRIGPKPGRKTKMMKATTQFDIDLEKDALLIKRLKSIPQHRWAEYFYRTQKSVAVKNVKIGDDEKLIPLEQTVGNPLSDEEIIVKNCRIYPEAFSSPTPMLFESEEGDKIYISFQQTAYDSLTEIKIHNIDFPALRIEVFIYNPLVEVNEETAKTDKKNQVIINYSVIPTNAASTSMALTALHIFRGIIIGTIKVNGQMLVSELKQDNIDLQRVDEAILFWSTAAKLEDKLGIKFMPGADFPMEDVEFFSELDTCLNKKKKITWQHPFDHFRITDYHSITERGAMDNIVGKDKLYFRFIEGPISCTLLGADFEIYSLTEMEDLIMTNIEWDNEEKQNGEIYIKDVPGKVWTLKRLYMTKEEANKLKQ